MTIHPTAIIDPGARVDPTVCVGPYAVIDAGVEVGPHCVIGPHVHLTGLTRLGHHNRLFAGCVLGEAPQDLKYDGSPTALDIGDHNVFREHATVHRSAKPGEATRIGSHNYFMAHSHVGHNVCLGNHVILANGALLAGHAIVHDRAFISGHCLVHQFTRVGTLALMQGGSGISKDLPPFTVAFGNNRMCGLNSVGLRRAGFSQETRLELKRLYHALFRSRKPINQALADARAAYTSEPAQILMAFVETSRRGIVCDTGVDHD